MKRGKRVNEYCPSCQRSDEACLICGGYFCFNHMPSHFCEEEGCEHEMTKVTSEGKYCVFCGSVI